MHTLIILNEDVDAFTTEKLEIECTLVGYGGNCGKQNVCDEKIFINITNLKGSSFSYSCSIDENESCIIKVTCFNCEIQADASIFVNSKGKFSYASEIYVNITSNSSIPEKISSIKNGLFASESSVFIGSEPSEFYYTMTPSLFQSESSRWPSQLTGYHISDEKFPLQGSQNLEVNLAIVAELNVMIYLYKSNSGLQTKMLIKQSLIILVSGIIGSVFGIFGTVSAVMEFIEGKFIEKKKKSNEKIKLVELKSRRKNISIKNFSSSNRNKIWPLDDTNLLLNRNFSLD
ncbi:hypothetical protein SteCoe_19004 [Stentor coeruleus]|uniref:Uncharacterized protein n=1 Tax=Stentor coeruleus TaxID=5963 RepID=A0A1R2BVF1_9CILI|nr:hypothetical protein SteCoe_19004 [Stentor coeruleus]